mgnify:CR=1 FL=1
MAFWSSLVFTGTRIAGQRERQTQAYEAGTTYFPRDYPSTSAYRDFWKEEAGQARESWERKPPAKRTNFEKLHVKDPWEANWERILGVGKEDGALVSTQREQQGNDVEPWLFRGELTAKIVESLASSLAPAHKLVQEINRLRDLRAMDPLPAGPANKGLLRAALINVKVNVCGRGLPQDLALIYALDDAELNLAARAVKGKNVADAEEESDQVGDDFHHPLI